MPDRLETTEEVDRSSASDQGLLARESVSSLSDIKAIFGSPNKGATSALEEQFGDLLLVDDSASDLRAGGGKTPLVESRNDRLGTSGPAQDRIIEDVNDPPVRRIDSQNGVVELDENGQTRRAVEVDQEGLRSREVKVPEGFIPTEGPAAPKDKFETPQDKLVDIDNKRRPEITLNNENSGFETDSDGEISRAFVVDDDGRKSTEIEVD